MIMVEGGSISRVASHHSQAASAPISRVPSSVSAVSMQAGLNHMDRNSAPDHVVRVLLWRLRGTVYYQLIMAASTLACALYIFLKPVPTTWSDADVYVVLCQGVYVVLRIYVCMRSYITVYHGVCTSMCASLCICVCACVCQYEKTCYLIRSFHFASFSFVLTLCRIIFLFLDFVLDTTCTYLYTRTRLRYF